MTPPRNPEITWVLPVEAANYILAVLGDRPLKEAAPIDRMLREQAQKQLQGLPPPPDQGESIPQRRMNGGAEDRA